MKQQALMANIMMNSYTLGELEERFELSPVDLRDGFEPYVEENFDEVALVLQEDLFFMED